MNGMNMRRYTFKQRKLLCLAFMHLGSLSPALPSHKIVVNSQLTLMWIGDTILHTASPHPKAPPPPPIPPLPLPSTARFPLLILSRPSCALKG